MHKTHKLVYNAIMSLSATLIASVVSAILEVATQPAARDPALYENYVQNRRLPPQVKYGHMQTPKGDGFIIIDDKQLQLSPVAQFRNQKNLIVMSMSIQAPSSVLYVFNTYGTVHRVWMVSEEEAEFIEASMNAIDSPSTESDTSDNTTTTP